jgi:hypothetical protein
MVLIWFRGFEGHEVTRGRRILHKENLVNFCFSIDIIKMTKRKGMTWEEDVDHALKGS